MALQIHRRNQPQRVKSQIPGGGGGNGSSGGGGGCPRNDTLTTLTLSSSPPPDRSPHADDDRSNILNCHALAYNQWISKSASDHHRLQQHLSISSSVPMQRSHHIMLSGENHQTISPQRKRKYFENQIMDNHHRATTRIQPLITNHTTPKLDLRLSLESTSSSTSPPTSSASSTDRLTTHHHKDHQTPPPNEDDQAAGTTTTTTTATMVLVGCPRCLMYVMLSEDDPCSRRSCPKCKSSVLLDFVHGDTTAAADTTTVLAVGKSTSYGRDKMSRKN